MLPTPIWPTLAMLPVNMPSNPTVAPQRLKWASTALRSTLWRQGPIQTGYITPEAAAEIADGTPLGRVGEPEDVADVIVFLVSEQARWMTGQLLYVGGGWRMHQ